ncbi:Crp/Fnr family transcriptional regulator [Celeribacter halophilus]|nr:Crp/Fnr family transcriptional regulator [Celeribacter halophilus]
MDWIDRFAGLSTLEPRLRARLVAQSQIVHLPAGTVLFGPGKRPENLLLLTEGTARVQQTTEGGREIVLYRVHGGESCVMTTACLLAYEDYTAEGIAETDVDAVAIPRRVFDDLIAHSQSFRDFVFSAYSRRITDLFHVIEEIAFQKVDIRLAQKLLELTNGEPVLKVTHAQLAAELGSAREVISRQLQEFQRRGWVQTARGEVRLIDREALDALANSG